MVHKWLGHILRHEGFLCDVIEGQTMGKLLKKGKEKLLHDVME